MNQKEAKIKIFWEEQAKKFKRSAKATAPDVYYRNLEIQRISAYLKNNKKALDVGCGNGFSTIAFAKEFPGLEIVGIDYSESMIKQAKALLAQNKRLQKRVSFEVGDVSSLSDISFLRKKFDHIISERCLINLSSWEKQKKALLEMKKVLNRSGKIILCENTQEGLQRLNQLRIKLGLEPIKTRWHNRYLPERKLLEFAADYFQIEDVNNIGSLYYIISRVVYAKLCQLKGKEPVYLNPINQIASQLPSLGNFSPNFIFLLANK